MFGIFLGLVAAIAGIALSTTGMFNESNSVGNAFSNYLGLDSDTGDAVWKTQMHNNSMQSQLQRDWQEKMYFIDREYQSPANQMRLYREAGLNPSLMYGQPIQTGQLGAGAEGSYSGSPVSQLGSLLGLGTDVATMPAQIDLMRAQADEIRSRIPLNRARVDDVNAHAEKVRTEAKKAGIDLSIAEQTLPSVVSAAIAKNNFDKESNEAAMRYVNQTAEANFNILEQQLENLRKDGSIKEEIYKQEKEKLKSYRSQATIDKYAEDNKEAAFWLGKIDSLWDLVALGVIELKPYIGEIKGGLEGMGKGFLENKLGITGHN